MISSEDFPINNASYTSILLNNRAVNQFKAGNMLEALETFSQAVSVSQEATLNTESSSDSAMFRYHWVDCTSTYCSRPATPCEAPATDDMCVNEGVAPFLCLRALKISVPMERIHMIDSLCPYTCLWAIEFNLALVCNIMGARLGEKGHNLLTLASKLFRKVQVRICKEQPSRDWTLLQMTVANNLACIYQELGMKEDSDKCLGKLGETLSSFSALLSGNPWDAFFLNCLILSGLNYAPAA